MVVTMKHKIIINFCEVKRYIGQKVCHNYFETETGLFSLK